MIWLLKLSFDQSSIIINHNFNDVFDSHIILEGTQERLLALLDIFSKDLN
jgi:hypothetical protein